MISLGSKTWGSSPSIPISFEYEKKRSGSSMGYRVKVTISSVSGASYFGYPIYMKLTMDGVLRETVALKAASPSRWTSAITYTSPWYWVSNKTSGTTEVKFNIYSGSGESRDYTYTYSMAIDPAASEFVTVGNGTLGTAQTITLKKYDSSFTHTIEYACEGIYGTVCTKVTDTSISFTPPLALARANTTGTSVKVTLTLITYNSSGSAINSVSKTITCTIPDIASLKPSISVKVTDTSGCFDKYGKYVQGKSELEVDIDSSGVYGATVQSYSLTFDGRSHTVGNDGIVNIPNIIGTGTLSLVATATDSRGRKSTKTVTLAVLEYSTPKVTDLVVRRSGKTGNSNPTGEYLAIHYSASISPLDNKNSAKYSLRYKKTGDSNYTVEELTSLNGVYVATGYVSVIEAETGSSYEIILIAEDDFGATEKAGVGSSIEVLWSREAKGRGFAFGKVAEYISSLGKRLEVAWNAQFEKNVTVGGVLRGNGYSVFPKGYGAGGETTSEGYLKLTLAEVGGGSQTTIKAASQTGILKVVLPMDFCGSMVKFDVEIFSYNRQALCTYSFGGQIYKNNDTGGYSWAGRSYDVKGSAASGNFANLPIAFGRHNGKAAVSIGATDTVWGNCLIVVRNFEVFYAYVTADNWNDGWEMICDTTPLNEILSSYTSPADRAITSMGIADWIVEQGTSGMWTYRKWASGIAECWAGNFTDTWNYDGGLMGGFLYKKTYDLPSGLFAEAVTGSMNGHLGSGVGWAEMRVGGVGYVDCYICGNSDSSTATIQGLFVKGRWK